MEPNIDLDFDAVLEHYGVKGMKWGVRKRSREPKGPSDVAVKVRPGRKVKTKGGSRHTASEDAIKAARARQIAKRSTTDALSNEELRALVMRMQLEDNYQRIITSDARVSTGKLLARNLAKELDTETVVDLTSDVATSLGKPLSEKTQAQIALGTTVTRIAFGAKGVSQEKKEAKKRNAEANKNEN